MEQPKKKNAKPQAAGPDEVRGVPDIVAPGPELVIGARWAISKGFAPKRMDGALSQREATALTLIFNGLQQDGAEIPEAGGNRATPVTTQFRAIRWMLSQAADQLHIDHTGRTPLGETYTPRVLP